MFDIQLTGKRGESSRATLLYKRMALNSHHVWTELSFFFSSTPENDLQEDRIESEESTNKCDEDHKIQVQIKSSHGNGFIIVQTVIPCFIIEMCSSTEAHETLVSEELTSFNTHSISFHADFQYTDDEHGPCKQTTDNYNRISLGPSLTYW